jgi:membrane-associated phospholipid phosphatase
MSYNLLIGYIGYYAPLLLLIVSTLFLRNRCTYLKFFIYGYAGTIVLNSLLKILIKEPRPSKDKRILEIAIQNGNRIGFDKYGMPSGHAQVCGFCLAFMTMLFKSPSISLLYLVISIITMYQRYIYNNHTIMQLIVGFIIGIGTGIMVYLLGHKNIKGVLKMKPDDNGPL